jgi:hypothetical protein
MAGNNRVETILARFPGPVTMPVSRIKALGVLLGCVAFVAIGVLILRYGDGEAEEIFGAWLAIVFFGLCAVVAAVMLLPGAGSLTLAADGFTMCSLFRKAHTPWRQASDFTVARSRDRRMTFVGYEDARASGAAAETSRSLIGRNAALPDTYGLSHEELARLLTQWRALALVEAQRSRAPASQVTRGAIGDPRG